MISSAILRGDIGELAPPNSSLDPSSLAPLIETLIDESERRLRDLARRHRSLTAASDQLVEVTAADAGGLREKAEIASNAARQALQAWGDNQGKSLQELFAAMGGAVLVSATVSAL